MFAIKKITEQGFDKLILLDEVSNTSVAIIPKWGAMLHAFKVKHKGETVNVIESYDNGDDIEKNLVAKGFRSSKLSPFVCRIKNAAYYFGEKDYKITKFLMGKNAIHGLVYDAAFEVVAHLANEEKASISLLHKYRGEDPGYPFSYDCIVHYTLEKENSLSVETTVINKSEGLIPVQDGWHPYFTFGKRIDDLQLEFQSKEMLEFDEELIPTGNLIAYDEFNVLKKIGTTEYDNCFTLNFDTCQPLCVLRDAEQGLQVEIRPHNSYPYMQFYTPPHRNSIAIENLSGAPDAFNNGMGVITLTPGEEAVFKTVYKLKAV